MNISIYNYKIYTNLLIMKHDIVKMMKYDTIILLVIKSQCTLIAFFE